MNLPSDQSATEIHTQKNYAKPTLRKLTPEQAKSLLNWHASRGNRDARELLELLFPQPSHAHQSRSDEECPAGRAH